MARFVDYWNGPGAWSRLRLESRASIGRLAGKVAQDFHAVFRDPTPLEAYAWLRVPTLLLCGERSPEPARRVALRLAQTLPRVRMKTVAGAGHMLPLSHGDTVAGLIAARLGARRAVRRRAA